MTKLRIKPKIVSTEGSLSEMPQEIFENRDLLKIKLNENKIKGVPKEIENLPRLETLDLSGNRIKQVYSKLFQLPKLKILILNNNRLINLPKQVSLLKRLRLLQLQNNNLQRLPNEIGELQNLREVNLSYNKFNKFPEVLFQLKNLKTIWLGGNYFGNFPLRKIVYELPNLKRLYTYSNINYDSVTEVDALYAKYNGIRGNNLHKLKKELDVKPRSMTKKTIFISYAHEDKTWLDKLSPYLKVLQNEGLQIDPWDDRKIAAGDTWRNEIKENLQNAEAAILLISTPFLASDFIVKNELPPLLELAKKRGLKIYCVIVGYSRFTNHRELAEFQTVNDPNQPLSSFADRPHEIERILVELSNSISKDFSAT